MEKWDRKQTEEAIQAEIGRADSRYGPFTSAHEGLGVLVEEFDELKIAIRSNKLESVRAEAIQVAAVAWRIALSLDVASTQDRSHP